MSGLPAGEARMAEALRVFVLTWDPLELDEPRPDGFAAVNPGSLGLEVAVYVPIWGLINLAAARHESIAATLTAIAGSAVVTAAVHEQEVTAGRYPTLVLEHSVPDLLADLPAGAALGQAGIRADPPSWEDIGLGAIQDVVQHAFGPVDLDRSQVELEALLPGQLGCPACEGIRFGFPADLSESQSSMCATHSKQADAVIMERLGRAERSNPNGWGALGGATIRRERPHLPNGLATRLAGAGEALYVVPEPTELAERARAVVEAADWFPRRGHDFGVALEMLGDPGGARAHFEAARAMADRPADFAERAAAVERLLRFSRKERLADGRPKIQRIQRVGKASPSKRRRGR